MGRKSRKADTDFKAAGVLQALHVAGLKAPEDLSIVGFDDFETATRIWPRLTTVHTPAREIGRLAAQSLLAFGKEDGPPGPNQTVPELIVLESTRELGSA